MPLTREVHEPFVLELPHTAGPQPLVQSFSAVGIWFRSAVAETQGRRASYEDAGDQARKKHSCTACTCAVSGFSCKRLQLCVKHVGIPGRQVRGENLDAGLRSS